MAWWGRDGHERGEIDVERWPEVSEPARYLGGLAVMRPLYADADVPSVGAVLLRWAALTQHVGMLWPTPHPYAQPSYVEAAFTADPGIDVVVKVNAQWTPWGPDLEVYNRAGDHASARWGDLATKLGAPLPWWPFELATAELLLGWRPGAPTVTALATPILDVEPLLRAAATFPDGHATRRTLTLFAQVLQHRGTAGALFERELLTRDYGRLDTSALLVAAEPLATPEADLDDLDEAVRRAGWLELLSRADALSSACVQQAMMFDGGADFPASYQAHLEHDTHSSWAREWIARLTPAPLTTAHRRLLSPDRDLDDVIALVDPATDAPVVRSDDGYRMALPQRLPAATPLAELVLDEPVIWVRVEDGSLYPAPSAAAYGISWGYAGGGPGALALLAHRLLVDINAPGAERPSGAPEGLDDLFEQKWPVGTVLTRAQLEEARGGPYLGEG